MLPLRIIIVSLIMTAGLMPATNTSAVSSTNGIDPGANARMMSNNARLHQLYLSRVGFYSNSKVDSHIIAYYGSPRSKKMGILGKYPKEEIARMLRTVASNYDATNGRAKVVGAFYIIYATCGVGGSITTLSPSVAESYIQYAKTNNMLVFLDHQIGKYSVASAIRTLLPFLSNNNVHLGLDPEWRTEKPLEEIGQVTAAEINEAQSNMQAYMMSNRISGKRMLVFHQFHEKMVAYRRLVRSDYDRVEIVHVTSGIGGPASKRMTHEFNAYATNLINKGFKLWYSQGYSNVPCDNPIMTPAQVLSLKPEPMLIIYQ